MKSVTGSVEEMTRATQRIQALCGASVASELGVWLSKAQTWSNSIAFFHSLATAADRETLQDHLATLRYSLIFRGLGFIPAYEPTGPTGSDLLITRHETSATVEVTRFRPINPGPPILTQEELHRDDCFLQPYGDPERDLARCLRKVTDKFRQATGEHAIIAVWNDDEAIEEINMRLMLSGLRDYPGRPAGLELVVYGSWWIGRSQLFSFHMKPKLDAPFQKLAQQLESVSVPAAVHAALAFDDRPLTRPI
jgi:hypothetical protein